MEEPSTGEAWTSPSGNILHALLQAELLRGNIKFIYIFSCFSTIKWCMCLLFLLMDQERNGKDCAKTTAKREERHLSCGIWCVPDIRKLVVTYICAIRIRQLSSFRKRHCCWWITFSYTDQYSWPSFAASVVIQCDDPWRGCNMRLVTLHFRYRNAIYTAHQLCHFAT